MSDKIMLVTGGSRGIGAATARLAAARGYAVCVNYTQSALAAEELVAEIETGGGRALAVQADVSDEAEVERLFATMDGKLGRITALVNNAGLTGRISRLDEVSGDTLRQVVEVNLLGVLYCSRAAVQRMSPRHGGAGGGIVNIASAASTIGSPGEFVWYAATKGAVDSFTLGLAKEVGGEGIRVNAVSPGLVETEIHATAGRPDRVREMSSAVPMGRGGSAEEVAGPVLWLLSEEASYVNGAILRIGGGR